MANTILFKRLFELRFLHEFYLAETVGPGRLFFEKSFNERQGFLEQQILQGKYNILRDLDFVPTLATEAKLRGYGMKLSKTATGFIVGASGKKVMVDGRELFQPDIKIEEGFRLAFMVRVKNPHFTANTALRFQRPADLPTSFWFSNILKPAPTEVFPALSAPVLPFQPGQLYFPGELAEINGELFEAVAQTNTPNPSLWAKVNGRGYVNENDRRLLPKRFAWNWTGAPGAVTFVLTSPDGTVIKSIDSFVSETSRQVTLDFAEFTLAGQTLPLPDGRYKLDAFGVGSSLSKEVFLRGDWLENANAISRPVLRSTNGALLGLVEIIHDTLPTTIPYLDEAGRRSELVLPDGSRSHPVYEVRLLSRAAWWRFRSDRDRVLAAQNGATVFLEKSGNDLVSKQSKRLSAFSQVFSQPGTPDVRLPNPTPGSLRPGQDGRLYADVLVSKVPNLIEAT